MHFFRVEKGWGMLTPQDSLTRMSQDEQIENLMSKIPQGACAKFVPNGSEFFSEASFLVPQKSMHFEDRPVKLSGRKRQPQVPNLAGDSQFQDFFVTLQHLVLSISNFWGFWGCSGPWRCRQPFDWGPWPCLILEPPSLHILKECVWRNATYVTLTYINFLTSWPCNLLRHGFLPLIYFFFSKQKLAMSNYSRAIRAANRDFCLELRIETACSSNLSHAWGSTIPPITIRFHQKDV